MKEDMKEIKKEEIKREEKAPTCGGGGVYLRIERDCIRREEVRVRGYRFIDAV
jgi:hypothetical protein